MFFLFIQSHSFVKFRFIILSYYQLSLLVSMIGKSAGVETTNILSSLRLRGYFIAQAEKPWYHIFDCKQTRSMTMTTKDFQQSSALRIFLSYFKPHRRLFFMDLS